MRRWMIAVAGMVVLVVAQPAHAGGATAPTRPLEVIGLASRGSPAAWKGIEKLVASANPIFDPTGAGNKLEPLVWQGLAGALGVPTLAGLDTSAPLYVIYADDGQNRGLVVVTRVSDATA